MYDTIYIADKIAASKMDMMRVYAKNCHSGESPYLRSD